MRVGSLAAGAEVEKRIFRGAPPRALRVVRLLSFLMASFVVHAGASVQQAGPCQGGWVWEQGRQVLGPSFVVFDFSSKGADLDAQFAKNVEDGKMKSLVDLVVQAMVRGEASPAAVELAGNDVTLKPVAAELTRRLDKQQLLHLNFLLVGPKELEGPVKSFLEARGATFNFAPYEQRTCEASSGVGTSLG